MNPAGRDNPRWHLSQQFPTLPPPTTSSKLPLHSPFLFCLKPLCPEAGRNTVPRKDFVQPSNTQAQVLISPPSDLMEVGPFLWKHGDNCFLSVPLEEGQMRLWMRKWTLMPYTNGNISLSLLWEKSESTERKAEESGHASWVNQLLWVTTSCGMAPHGESPTKVLGFLSTCKRHRKSGKPPLPASSVKQT